MTKQAMKACSQLDAKQYRQVVSAILALTINPEPHDSQPLQGGSRGERRIDAGEYRIIYGVEPGQLVDILVVGKRNDGEVYKLWERQA